MLSDAYCPEDGRPGLHHMVPSDLYPLVLRFLQDNQLLEVVNKFTKATGATQQDSNASSLVDIYSFWLKSIKALKRNLQANGPVTKKAKKKTLPSDSSEDSSEEEKAQGPPAKKTVVPAKRASLPPHPGKAAAKAAESSNSEESSDEEEEKKKPIQKGVKPQSKAVKAPSKKSKSSDSDSDSSSEDESPKNQKPKTTPVAAKAQAKASAKPGTIFVPKGPYWGAGCSGDWYLNCSFRGSWVAVS